MPLLEQMVAMLGLHTACNPAEGGSEQLFALNRVEPNFPSLDQFSAACPALPRIRDLQKAIDTGYRNFTRSWGDLIESFFNPFLDFLIWTENLLVSAPWWLTLVVLTVIVFVMTRRRLHTGAVVGRAGGYRVLRHVGRRHADAVLHPCVHPHLHPCSASPSGC